MLRRAVAIRTTFASKESRVTAVKPMTIALPVACLSGHGSKRADRGQCKRNPRFSANHLDVVLKRATSCALRLGTAAKVRHASKGKPTHIASINFAL